MTPSIVTTGEAVVRRAPDQAFVTVSVESRARNPRDAQRQNAETMTAVQQRIAAAGVPKDAVRTLGYNIQQEFDYVDGRRVARGYLARNAVEVRVDAIDRTGEVLDAAVQAGATSVPPSGSISRTARPPSARRSGSPSLMRARVPMRPRPAPDERSTACCGLTTPAEVRVGPPRPMMAMAREAADVQQTPIEAGELEIRAQVTLTVSIK